MLTNWVNLSIIFDLFGTAIAVCVDTNDRGLPQTMLEEINIQKKAKQKESNEKKKESFLSPPFAFISNLPSHSMFCLHVRVD
jgi:hypothetical protein